MPFVDLAPSHAPIAEAVVAEIAELIGSGQFTNGPQVAAFEREFAAYCGVPYCIGLASGLDALRLALLAAGIERGDEVIVPADTFIATFEAVTQAGGVPVPAEVSETDYNLDPEAAEAAASARSRFLLPVHLYGQLSDMRALLEVAARHELVIVEDACQAHGATCAGRGVGTFGSAGAFSFYPTKNLGALGDGGAVVTNDAAVADKLKRLRNGGQTDRYHHPELGVNSRLDELQAAVLRVRLPRLAAGNARRRAIAARYRSALAGGPVVVPPECDPGHVYHLFPVLARDRAAFQAHLQAQGIGTLVHYPIPVPRQAAFAAYAPAACPIADRICAEVCSLPMHPQLSDEDAREVAAAVTTFRDPRGAEAPGRMP